MRMMAHLLLLLLPVLLSGCSRADEESFAEKRGAALIKQVGCGTCHDIPGIADAKGVVGPPLMAVGRRVFIAGILKNTPENMTRWLEDPQKIVPGNAMPNMGLTREQAQQIAAYLDTLR
jgi:cytochrome c1